MTDHRRKHKLNHLCPLLALHSPLPTTPLRTSPLSTATLWSIKGNKQNELKRTEIKIKLIRLRWSISAAV